ncbi:hypothetical protein KIN20_033837 [Parelaphostrongylus tenuis]|uniref:MYND-type domain-containing protein n=1 Tax=Parelaphostrongylus tenuis TaxID=148309 RepID=A0AAD5WJJ6_PARTN|nr:hypothetical protein KIN20_033837 [Parelaphostrongylus tenuis]
MREATLEHDPSTVVDFDHQPIDNKLDSDQVLHHSVMFEKCRYCGYSDVKLLKKCTFCAAVAYCSEEHQQFDWKRHKPMCKQIQAEAERQITLSGPSSCTACTQTETRYAAKTMDEEDSHPSCESVPSVSLSNGIASSPSSTSTSTTLFEDRVTADYPDVQETHLVTWLL